MAVVRELYGCCISGMRLSPDADGAHHPASLAGAVARFVREKKTISAPAGMNMKHGASPRRGPAALRASTPRSLRVVKTPPQPNHLNSPESGLRRTAPANRATSGMASHIGQRAPAPADAIEGV